MEPAKFFERRTKIVCTIGPATASVAMIERLITAGMNVARFNLSHGTADEHARYIRIVRRLSRRLGIPVGVLIDLPGPKYRIGKLKGSRAILEKGAPVILTTRAIEGDANLVPVSLPYLAQDVKVEDTILLADGVIELKVQAIKGDEVNCRVKVGGLLTEGCGLVVPGMRSSVPFITDTLRQYIHFAVEQQPDYLALSFVAAAEDITGVRAILQEGGVDIPIIAKIERRQVVDTFDKILSVSDGVMVARGDLGVDIPLEKVPLVQKEIIKKCNWVGKPVITATEMLESMVKSVRPTRAEAADVANAIFDGSDAIMLSSETSVGKHPVRAVTLMSRIAREVERKLPYQQMLTERGRWLEHKTDELISYNACYTAYNLGAVAIVAFTQSGSTAGRVSKYRPRVPILAITSSNVVSGRLLLRWGVYPFRVTGLSSVDELFDAGAKLVKELGLARAGDLIVITGGVPIGLIGSTNLLKVEEIK